MKKAVYALVATLALTTTAKAETFVCGFTEPFVTFTYSTETQKLVEHDDVMDKTRKLGGVKFEVAGPNVFVLRSAAGQPLARLTLDNKGSDSMSETVYPYSVEYYEILGRKNTNYSGGCTSTLLKETFIGG